MNAPAWRTACRAAVVLALVGTGWAAWQAGTAALDLWSDRQALTGAEVTLEGVEIDSQALRLQRRSGPAGTLRLDTVSRAVVFVYDPTCSVCRRMVAGWTDIVTCDSEGMGQRRYYALYFRRDSETEGRARLPPLDRVVDLAPVRADVAAATLKLSSTPATALIEDGHYRRVYTGLLRPDQQKEVERHVGC